MRILLVCVVRNRQRSIVSILYPKTYFVSLTLSLNSWQQDLWCRVHELGTIVQSLGFQRKQSQRRKMSHTPLTSGALARICQVFLTNLSSKLNSRKWCILHLRIVKCTEQFSGGGCPWASASSAWPKTNSRRGSGEVDWFCRNDIFWIECMQWSQNNSWLWPRCKVDDQCFPTLKLMTSGTACCSTTAFTATAFPCLLLKWDSWHLYCPKQLQQFLFVNFLRSNVLISHQLSSLTT